MGHGMELGMDTDHGPLLFFQNLVSLLLYDSLVSQETALRKYAFQCTCFPFLSLFYLNCYVMPIASEKVLETGSM